MLQSVSYTLTLVYRLLWPKEIWSLYAAQLQDFLLPLHVEAAVNCLNHMICDALQHACHIPEYLALVDPSVLRFSAVAQVMALATLVQCWNNPQVFSGIAPGNCLACYQACSCSVRNHAQRV